MEVTQILLDILIDSKDSKEVMVDYLFDDNKLLAGTLYIHRKVNSYKYHKDTNYYEVNQSVYITADLDLIDADGRSYDFDFDLKELEKYLEDEY